MIFKLGHFYKYVDTDTMISIVGEIKTTSWGKTLVAECSTKSDLMIMNRYNSSDENWVEITKGEWLSNFYNKDNTPPLFTEKILNLNIVQPSGYLYPTEVVLKTITELNNNDKSVFGTMGMPKYKPESPGLNVEDISHSVSNLRIEDNVLMGDVQILNTPKGKVLWDCMQECDVEFKLASIVNLELNDSKISMVSMLEILGIHSVPVEKKNDA